MSADRLAVVVDYGGVLTNPLSETLEAYCAATGITAEQIATAFAAVAAQDGGVAPMSQLEVAAITEETFVAKVSAALVAAGAPRPPARFGEIWFRGRRANEPFVDYLRELRTRGHPVGLLTNNVAEWEPLWKATIPVDELFDAVVVSSEERMRKPDPRIYDTMVERLGLPASQCVFVDDVEENCAAAEQAGMTAVRFRDHVQAIAEIEALLAAAPAAAGARG